MTEKDNTSAESESTSTPKPEDAKPKADPKPDEPKKTADETSKSDSSVNAEKISETAKAAVEGTGKALAATYKKIRETVQASDANITRIEKILEWFRKIVPIESFDKFSDRCIQYGYAAIVATQLATALFFILAIVRTGKVLVSAGQGLGFILALMVVQYTAKQFLGAGKDLLQSSPSRLRSSAFLDCLGLLTALAGIIIFVKLGTLAQWVFFFAGLGIAILGLAMAYVALNPNMVSVTISSDTRAGEEAIGILSFLVKAIVKIVPALFGLGTIGGCALLLAALWPLLAHGDRTMGVSAYWFVFSAACLPFMAYVAMILYHLLVDIIRAILILPSKLDELKK